MPEANEKLPTTSFAVLGLLTFGEMSGYDLVKAVGRSVGFFWTPAKSQIYAELRRLVSVRYATEREVEQTLRPDKRLYRITPKGEAALRAWLEDAALEPETIKFPLLLKVFFAHRMSRETLVEQLQAARGRAEGFIAELREIEADIKDVAEMAYPYLTLKFGLAHARATIRWCDDALKDLRKGELR